MLPIWIIKKIEDKKEKFIQEQLYIEEYAPILEEKIEKKEEIERGVIIIDMF